MITQPYYIFGRRSFVRQTWGANSQIVLLGLGWLRHFHGICRGKNRNNQLLKRVGLRLRSLGVAVLAVPAQVRVEAAEAGRDVVHTHLHAHTAAATTTTATTIRQQPPQGSNHHTAPQFVESVHSRPPHATSPGYRYVVSGRQGARVGGEEGVVRHHRMVVWTLSAGAGGGTNRNGAAAEVGCAPQPTIRL